MGKLRPDPKTGILYAEWRDHRGERKRRSTRTRDRKAAAIKLRKWERDDADPTYAAADQATIGVALERMIADRIARGRAEGTIRMYRSKAGHFLRIWGASMRLSEVDAKAVDAFIDQRLDEGASRHTIHKELTTLRVTLKIARRRGDFHRHHDDVMPVAWSPDYRPRELAYSHAEVDRLIAALPSHRARWVAFVVATGARWSEVTAAQTGDLDLERMVCHLRGTKTEGSDRDVPIVPWAERYARMVGKLPLRRWPHGVCSRDLRAACRRAGIPEGTANDLRRTAGTWIRERTGSASLVGSYLGHADEAMAARVYARLGGEQLGATIKALAGGDRGK